MNITIEINDARLEHYSPEAKNELKRQLDTIADNLAEEANRIEAGRRQQTSTSEVTQSDVCVAGILSKISQKENKSSWWYVWQSISTFSGVFLGWLFDEDKLKQGSWRLYVFLLCLIIFVISTLLTFTRDGSK